MKVTLNWLREFVPVDLEVGALCERLALAGLEVDGVEDRGAEIAGVVVGEIVSTAPHPSADRLTLCEVRTGADETFSVVCGATNMKAGDRVAYAPPGAALPGGRTIEAAEIRGARSLGMLCSEAELGLSEDHAGILILPPDAPLGEPVAAQVDLDDTVIELSITPNRGDCLSVLGVAREVAVLTGQRLLRQRLSVRERGAPAADSVRVRIDDPSGCAVYSARVVRGVRVAPSPRWLEQRLRSVGLRPINNVVDVTNYVMIERGQPLHAFDYDRLPRPEIVVRRAREGERIETLDGTARELAADDLLITAGEEPIAVAGVMGGSSTEVSDATVDVLLESAWFEPARVRRTRRRLDLPSESSFRFERGVDPGGVVSALNRAAQLVKQVAGGEIALGVVEASAPRFTPPVIHLRARRVEDVLGFEVGRAEISTILKALGAAVSAGPRSTLAVTPPTFRPDLAREIDLVEEVVRVVGYDRVPATMPAVPLEAGQAPERMTWADEVKRRLVALGFFEAIPLSFASARGNEVFPGVNTAGRAVRIVNPLTRDDVELRRSLLGNLIALARHNRNQGLRSIPVFSIGKVFWDDGGPREGWRLGGVLAGETPEAGLRAARIPELTDAKGIVESVLEEAGALDRVRWLPATELPPFHPGKSAVVRTESETIGVVGALHPDAEADLDFDLPHWLFELDLEKVLAYRPPRSVFLGLPRYPSIVRDLAVIVDVDFPADEIVQFVRRWRRELVEGVELFDEYVGAPIPPGKKSLAYSISYRASDRTLTDDAVNALHAELIDDLRGGLPVELR